MKNFIHFLACAIVSIFLFGCSNSETDSLSDKTRVIASGSVSIKDIPFTINLEQGRALVIDTISTNQTLNKSIVSLKATSKAITEYGPYYVYGDMYKSLTNEKVLINTTKIPSWSNVFLTTGAYVCDVYTFKKDIIFPSGVYYGRAEFDPNNSGFSNWSTQDLGVNYIITSSSSGYTLSMTFYTLLVNYNSLGQSIGKVIPKDGRQIPFKYYYAK